MTIEIGFIGVGKLGLPCAEVFAEYYDVQGFDLDSVSPANFPMARDLAEVCADKDVIFIAVPTPHDHAYSGETPSMNLCPRDFDYETAKSVLCAINAYTTPDQLVVLISTVLPGTTRAAFVPAVKNYRFVYNPYLVAMGTVKWDMVNPEMLIIGTEDGSETGDAKRLIELYRPIMHNNPRIVVGTWDEAECIKVFYNTFISAKISLVNMIQDVAERIGNVDVDIVTDALKKSKLRITGPAYMTAGMGDGGPCHPRDNIALRWLARDLNLGYDLFEAIMKSRESQALNMASTLVNLAEEHRLANIWIHGKAYKPMVGYTNGSYSILVAHYVRELGRNVGFVDPLTGDSQLSVHGVVLLAHAAAITYTQELDTNGNRFYCEIEPGSVVVDPWRLVRQADVPGSSIIHYGNTRVREMTCNLAFDAQAVA